MKWALLLFLVPMFPNAEETTGYSIFEDELGYNITIDASNEDACNVAKNYFLGKIVDLPTEQEPDWIVLKSICKLALTA